MSTSTRSWWPPPVTGPAFPPDSPFASGRRRPGRGELRAGRIDGPGGRLLPPVPVDQLGQRAAPHRPVLADRAADGDGGGDEHAIGYAQQLAEVVLDKALQPGQHAAVPE